MATVSIKGEAVEDVEVTPDYCFGKAAEALVTPTQHVDPRLMTSQSVEFAREWRELGLAIDITSRTL